MATAVRPALLRRWDEALASFDARAGIGVLGVRGRADTVEELIDRRGVEPVRWYGVWLFVDWLEFSGVELDAGDSDQVAATAAVELEASRRDPYRQLSRVFHLVGRKACAAAADSPHGGASLVGGAGLTDESGGKEPGGPIAE